MPLAKAGAALLSATPAPPIILLAPSALLKDFIKDTKKDIKPFIKESADKEIIRKDFPLAVLIKTRGKSKSKSRLRETKN